MCIQIHDHPYVLKCRLCTAVCNAPSEQQKIKKIKPRGRRADGGNLNASFEGYDFALAPLRPRNLKIDPFPFGCVGGQVRKETQETQEMPEEEMKEEEEAMVLALGATL